MGIFQWLNPETEKKSFYSLFNFFLAVNKQLNDAQSLK